MKKAIPLLVTLLTLSSCVFSKPSRSSSGDTDLLEAEFLFGSSLTSEEGAHEGLLSEDYSVKGTTEGILLSAKGALSKGSGSSLYFPGMKEEGASLTFTFQKAVSIETLSIHGTGEAMLTLTLNDRTLIKSFKETSLEDPLSGTPTGFDALGEGLLSFNISNLSKESAFHIGSISLSYRYSTLIDGSSSEVIPPSSSSEVSSSASLSSIPEDEIDYGNPDPTDEEYRAYAESNDAYPESEDIYRLKPESVSYEAEVAPVYRLFEKTDGSFYKVVDRYISREKMCFTFEEVAEYYSVFREVPPNYSTASKPRGDRRNRKVSKTYYKGDYSGASDYTNSLSQNWNEARGGYIELDIDLTGSYNNGSRYTRGMGRVVIILDGIAEKGYGEEPVIYFTRDHYNYFVEYYNYVGGWSAKFLGTQRSGANKRETPLTLSL